MKKAELEKLINDTIEEQIQDVKSMLNCSFGGGGFPTLGLTLKFEDEKEQDKKRSKEDSLVKETGAAFASLMNEKGWPEKIVQNPKLEETLRDNPYIHATLEQWYKEWYKEDGNRPLPGMPFGSTVLLTLASRDYKQVNSLAYNFNFGSTNSFMPYFSSQEWPSDSGLTLEQEKNLLMSNSAFKKDKTEKDAKSNKSA